ncbi:hypothetical protein CBD41_04055 [bacterium TMED181]|nr:hypothetical protein [Planctomycetota bacterium]OUW45404.1 MAG: hypothetical protein CBD41_04055 [bacterium TMED181]
MTFSARMRTLRILHLAKSFVVIHSSKSPTKQISQTDTQTDTDADDFGTRVRGVSSNRIFPDPLLPNTPRKLEGSHGRQRTFPGQTAIQKIAVNPSPFVCTAHHSGGQRPRFPPKVSTSYP